jgi:hypothetical protein
MTRNGLAGILVLMSCSWSQAFAEDVSPVASFSVREVEPEEVRVPGESADLWAPNFSAPSEVNLLQVVNRGDSNWQIIKDSRGVLGNQFQFANALPQGVRSERFLDGWGERQNRTFEVTTNNLLGNEVVTLQFTISYKTGGRYQDQGRYIGSVSIVPAYYSSWYGYDVNFRVCGITVAAHPEEHEVAVARMGIQLCMGVSTPIQSVEMKQFYLIDGLGNLKVKPAVFF